MAVVPRHHPATRAAAPITLRELAAFPLISYDTSRTAALDISRTFADAGLSPRFAYTVRDGQVIKAAVRECLGVDLLAEMAFDQAGEGDLLAIPLTGVLARCTAWAVLHHGRVVRNHTVELLGLLSGLRLLAVQRAVRSGSSGVAVDGLPMWSDVLQRLRAESGSRLAA